MGVSEFAIRANVIACLSERRAALMGFHLTACVLWISPFLFFFLHLVCE